MPEPRVEFELEGGGMDQLARNMESLESDLLGQLHLAVADAAEGFVDEASDLVPVDSGDLQSSIEQHRIVKGEHRITAGAGLGYGKRVEKISGFFTASYLNARDDLRNRIARVVLRK